VFHNLLKYLLAVFKLPGLVVQLFPSYSSVAAVTGGLISPPKAKAAVCVPQPAIYTLAVFIEFTDVQAEPSYSSVAAVLDGIAPPKANAAVCVPAPANPYLLLYSYYYQLPKYLLL
jgi:hypothetical protein